MGLNGIIVLNSANDENELINEVDDGGGWCFTGLGCGGCCGVCNI